MNEETKARLDSILFRGKTEDGKWVEGYYHSYETSNCEVIHNILYSGITDHIAAIGGWGRMVIPETVGRFTGLYDSTKFEDLTDQEQQAWLCTFNHKECRDNIKSDWKGKMIWEGDIVKMVYYPLGADPKVIEYYKTGIVDYRGYVCLKMEGTNVLNPEKACSHHKTEIKRYKHPSQGFDWIDRYALLHKAIVIGNFHDTPDLLK